MLASELEGNEEVKIVHNVIYDFTLQAKKHFKLSDVVLKESPVFVNRIGVEAIAETFLTLIENKEKILSNFEFLNNFKTCTLSNVQEFPTISKLYSLTKEHVIKKKQECKEEELLLKLVSALAFNGQKLWSNGEELMGLFPIASKAAHSCSPNVLVITSVHNIKFVAMKNIEKDELISFSYITPPVLLMPRKIRRKILFDNWGFICCCSRCENEDEVCRYKCNIKGGCGGFVVESFKDNKYTCKSCMKDIVASQLPFEDEAKITETFMVYEANATTVEVANLLEIYFFSKEKFGDDHFLCILMERMLMEMAIQYGQQDSFLEINCELVKHFYKRIEELFMNISPIAGALLLQPFITNHLVDLDDQEIKSISKRFLYYFKLRFGENDADVQIWSSSI